MSAETGNPTPQSAAAPAEQEPNQDLRSFAGLNATMFQGAFSDNVYRFFLMILALNLAATLGSTESEADKLAATFQGYVSLAFAIPWIVGVALAGWLGDRFSKAQVTQWTKLMEIAVMCGASGAFFVYTQKPMLGMWLGIGVMFLMALQSTFFSPSKYGILPEILSEKRIAWGNGILQGFTFIAIIVGTIVGPWLYATTRDQLWIGGLFLVICAVIGYMFSLTIRRVPAANPNEPFSANPFPNMINYGREILSHPGIKWAVAGYVVFQMVGLMMQNAAVHIAKNTFDIADKNVGMAMLPIVIGLGVGCFLTSYLSRKRIELGLIPLGAVGVLISCLAVWLMTPTGDLETIRPIIDKYHLNIVTPLMMGFVGFFSGVYSVPIQ